MGSIDALALDVNGFFYECAQTLRANEDSLCLFRRVCERIEGIRKCVNPRHSLIICVDGVAGMAKMNQQRQRRMQRNHHDHFNCNSFTPGTRLLDHLTKYIDWYIKMRMTCSTDWQHLRVIFSNEKVPGEGEHKVMALIKTHVPPDMSVCIYGSDADLIMLAVLLPHNKVTIMREDGEYINIEMFRPELLKRMVWEGAFDCQQALTDYVFLCSLVGNDFLPSIQCFGDIPYAMDVLLKVYRQIGRIEGHFTEIVGGRIRGRSKALSFFFQTLCIVEKCSVQKRMYYHSYPAKDFLDGMFWTINYYHNGMPDWEWYYPHPVAPLLQDIAKEIMDYKYPEFRCNSPMPPFLQLLVLLPRQDWKLLPKCMSHARIYRHYIPLEECKHVYNQSENRFSAEERRRNRIGKSFLYRHCGHRTTFYSYYGNIVGCQVGVTFL